MSDDVRTMFSRIAGRYDLMNRLLSARLDVRWRRKALRLLDHPPGRMLDLACGTFDLGLLALEEHRARTVHGCDFCLPMLQAGTPKRAARPLSATCGDALKLPYASGGFDSAVCAYGWRNFDDPGAALREIRRVLRPGGELLILEFLRPTGLWPRMFYATFGRAVFPVAGAIVARDASAYRYLRESIRGFLSQGEADALLEREGFGERRWLRLAGAVSQAVRAVAR